MKKVLALILALVLCLSMAGCGEGKRYEEAAALLESGSYDEAAAAFEALGDYKDAADMVTECAYQKAAATLVSGAYDEAAAAFEALGDYKDAADMVTECAYQEAADLGAAGRPALSALAFIALGDYKDAHEQGLAQWATLYNAHHTITAGNWTAAAIFENGSTKITKQNIQGGGDGIGIPEDVTAISLGSVHSLGLHPDGTVTGSGSNTLGELDLDSWTDIVAIDAGWGYSLGLRSDGTVLAAGDDSYGLSSGTADWTDIVAVDGGYYHTVGLKADGTVVAAGSNEKGQCNVGDWTDIVAISAYQYHTVGLKADGTVVTTGDFATLYKAVTKLDPSDSDPDFSGISDWTDIVSVAAGDKFTLGLKADGSLVYVGRVAISRSESPDWTQIKLPGEV